MLEGITGKIDEELNAALKECKYEPLPSFSAYSQALAQAYVEIWALEGKVRGMERSRDEFKELAERAVDSFAESLK